MAGDNPNFPVGTAAVSYFVGQTFWIHVFSTDGYTVTERYAGSNTGGWATGPLNVPASAVSATAWADNAGGHIRVYATFEDTTTEWCLDPSSTSWYQGQYTNI